MAARTRIDAVFLTWFNITTKSAHVVTCCAAEQPKKSPGSPIFVQRAPSGKQCVLEIGVALATGVFDKQTDVGVSLIKIYRDLD